MRCDEYCEGCDHCLPGGWVCGRCDALMTEDDPDYGGLCQECAGEDMARVVEALAEIIAIAGILEDDNSANFHAMQKIIQRAKEACAPPVGKETT